jgi:murein DD-endopeptidase MepM/ murein hydrolase activator NlpD
MALHMLSKWAAAAAAISISLLVLAPAASARSNANVAALQVALRAVHVYHGGVDGIAGHHTHAAIRRFQRRHHLHADGVAGPRTLRALGRRGRPALGSRIMKRGDRGWDVAALQFMLRRRGYSPGGVDGGYGAGTRSAVMHFQARAGLGVDGRAGPGTLRALRHRHRGGARRVSSGSPSGPVRFLRPVGGAIGDGFGYPGGRRHDGVDFPEPYGTRVGAAGRGTVIFAGWNAGGYGNLIVIQHRLGYQTWYAHLSAFAVHSGQAVAGGVVIGRVGSTGHSTGSHLHFEVRHNGVPINPVPYLLARRSLARRLFRASAPGCTEPGTGALPPLRQKPRSARLAGC